MDNIHIELFERFQQGGFVMWPLLILSLVALMIFVERALYLHRNQIRSREFLAGIENSLRKGRLIEALTVCQETPGPVSAMVKAGLLTFKKESVEIRETVREAAVVELGPINRRVGAIAAISQVGPIFGLLGTVIGLIDAFSQYEEQGVYVNAGHLSNGVWQALTTTATGLALGAVCLLSHHFLAGRIRAIAHEMEWVGQELISIFARIKSDAKISMEGMDEASEAGSGKGSS